MAGAFILGTDAEHPSEVGLHKVWWYCCYVCTLSAVRYMYLHDVNAETRSVVSLLLTEAESIVSHCQTADHLLQQIHRAAVVADI